MNAGTEPVQLVTFAVPSSSQVPTELQVAHSGLSMVLVSRESIALLNDEWKKLGIYFLLGAADDPDRYRAYVGEVGKSTLVQRVRHHAAKKDWWSRALLIRSSSDEFNSAEIGWLEGRLYDVLNNAVACDLMNGNRPGDSSPSAQMQLILERYVEPIMAGLRALGASPDTIDQKPEVKGKKKPKQYSESVSDLIAAGLLKAGTVLQPLKKNVAQTARVLADGKIEVGGVQHSSLSGAAKAAAGTVAEAGWDFWAAPSGTGGLVSLAVLRERLREESVNEQSQAAGLSQASPGKAAANSPLKAPGLAEVVAKSPELFPLEVFADYRGYRIDALIDEAGLIHLGAEIFANPSAAGTAARVHHGYAGTGAAATNGWTFWWFTDAEGVSKPLASLR